MIINAKVYAILLREIQNYNGPDEYARDMAHASVWHDFPGTEIPGDRIEALRSLYQIGAMSVRELLAAAEITQTSLSRRFGIPLRTVQGWAASENPELHRNCPLYVKVMMAECLGMLPFKVQV